MNNTETKILENALELYNKKGIDSITVRHIAIHMGIRHSNITYYFPKKNDIIDVLYRKKQLEIDSLIKKFESNKEMFDISLFADSFDILYKYRFVTINNSEIFKRIPQLKDIYIANKKIRNKQFKRMAKTLRDIDILQKDLSIEAINMLIINVTLINDYWIVYCDINPLKTFEEQKKFYLKLILNAFIPFITKKGLDFFNAKLKRDIKVS